MHNEHSTFETLLLAAGMALALAAILVGAYLIAIRLWRYTSRKLTKDRHDKIKT